MIEGFNILRNVGQFDSVTPGGHVNLTPLSLIYAENGRGKTTIAAILRSLALDEPSLVMERQRLGSTHPPHIVVRNNGQQVIFQNSAWSQPLPEIAIFDDAFVAANVCSGIDLGTSHRQNLHELILGAQGVALNSQLQELVAKIDAHNTSLREKGDAIPGNARGPFNVADFCDLEDDPDIEAKIEEAGRRLAAAKASDAIRQRSGFMPFRLPDFDIDAINAVLGLTLENLELDAAERVREHLGALANNGETWVAEGMGHVAAVSENTGADTCPFCAQDLNGSDLILHYQAYFSDAYKELKASIRQTGIGVRDTHGGDVPVAFERSIRTAVQTHEFWKDFAELPEIDVDTAAISREWTAAREAALQALREKAASPLEVTILSPDAVGAIQTYRRRIEEIAQLSDRLVGCNEAIDVVKEQAAADDVSALQGDLAKLNARKARFEPAVAVLCQEYIDEKTAKANTEGQRDAARTALDNYRHQIFPTYETAINDFLARFNASFRLGKMKSVNNRAGSSASYCVVINQKDVNVTASEGPSFRNTLSAGDRNTLALAFFFASLDQDSNLAQKIVVIDDPMTSLDEHRTLRTRQEMRGLKAKVAQMIVLSHSKPFLCALWEDASTNDRSAYRLARAASGSEIAEWDVRNDSITEHDKRYEMIAGYIQSGGSQIERKVAEALRPTLEAFMRVAYPIEFPPGQLLGLFIGVCNQRPGTIMSQADVTELRSLLDYANKFHHDTNAAWETEAINDTELTDFAERVVLFISRR